jgi:hypothetical protein
MDLTERLRELFHYDPETGWFTYKVHRSPKRIGTRAGSPSGHGYRKIGFDYIRIYEHQAAWLYVYDEWPPEVDHRNGDRSYNALGNLRIVSHSQNNAGKPSTVGISGARGVYLNRRTMRWFAKIQVQGHAKQIGTFNTIEEAHEAYLKAAELHFGEFAHHNRIP